jgi:hypothetical protein
MIIHPGSLNIVVSADASHADHPDAKSHTGGCVGLRARDGIPDSYFILWNQRLLGKILWSIVELGQREYA